MKAYTVNYGCGSSYNIDEKVIAKDEESIEYVLSEKNQYKKIEIDKITEISLESVQLKELSAGDLLRLIK